jgi:hypothetical protein
MEKIIKFENAVKATISSIFKLADFRAKAPL